MAERAERVQIYGIHEFLQDVLFPDLHYAYIFDNCMDLGGLFIRRPWVPKIEGFAENVVPQFSLWDFRFHFRYAMGVYMLYMHIHKCTSTVHHTLHGRPS